MWASAASLKATVATATSKAIRTGRMVFLMAERKKDQRICNLSPTAERFQSTSMNTAPLSTVAG
jgi:hypothetical protein